MMDLCTFIIALKLYPFASVIEIIEENAIRYKEGKTLKSSYKRRLKNLIINNC